MESSLKFAAIDIGSNAVRLLLAGVFEYNNKTCFKKISLTRMPIRLGEDAFIHKKISQEKISSLIKAMEGFKKLIESYKPIGFKGCATSAMREAQNGPEICQLIKDSTDLDIEIINGKKEAKILFENRNFEAVPVNSDYIYIDVGGGSTEISVLSNGKKIASESFNLGTIRISRDLVHEKEWENAKEWIKKNTADLTNLSAVGTGGNINKLFSLANVKKGKPLKYSRLEKVKRELQSITWHEKIMNLGLRPDRADVIIPAAKIYLNIMKWAQAELIHVPVVGLADGLVRIMYNELKESISLK